MLKFSKVQVQVSVQKTVDYMVDGYEPYLSSYGATSEEFSRSRVSVH